GETSHVRAAGTGPGLVPAKGWADKFIYPPYDFKLVDALITNFHLPGSSVMLLTCAFAGREFILSAYEEAKRTGYRFYSYGDSMLIV
ncbi:MAG: S-adenosylmethionine:tRNA ribosyltransferase-isomerase, partial [Candidatus Eisenbacteria bacterium]|nr:S-adenosylmethionine:tRNA ribosyltransferase-isomerase [Candidatus Eisenbacteria bacterium]